MLDPWNIVPSNEVIETGAVVVVLSPFYTKKEILILVGVVFLPNGRGGFDTTPPY